MTDEQMQKRIDELLAEAKRLPWYCNTARLILLNEVSRLNMILIPRMLKKAFESGAVKELFKQETKPSL